MDYGNKLRILRHDYKYSQQEIADKLEISKSKYCRIENNETTLDIVEFNKLIEIYNISAVEFLEIKFPITRTIQFPKKLLDQLETVINKNAEISDDWNLNREKFNELQKMLDSVLEIRSNAFDFPELNLEPIEEGTTVKTVNFDMRGERLIDKCIKLQTKYCKVLFGGGQ